MAGSNSGHFLLCQALSARGGTQASLNEFPLPKPVPEALQAFKLRDDLAIEALAIDG